jgi:hypothetical protein
MVICTEHRVQSSGRVERWGAPWCRLERPSGWACEAAERGAPWRAQARGESGISSVEIWMSVFQGVPWRRLGPRWEGAKTGCGNLQRRRWPGCGEKQESSALSPSWTVLGPSWRSGRQSRCAGSRGHSQETKPKPCRFGHCGGSSDPAWEVPPENGVDCGEMQPPVSH